MKKILLYILSFILFILLVGFILLHPVITPYFGGKPFPEIQKVSQPGYTSDDSLLSIITPKLEAILWKTANDLSLPAVSAAIGRNGSVAWANAVGYADIKASKLADIHTQFRIGSISKSVTSMAIGKLIEQGDLDLEDVIQDHVPYFDRSKPNIKIRQLASHTSGIRNYGFCFCLPAHEGFNNEQFESMAERVSVFADDDLLFEPGSNFSYATYNYTLLGAAIEEITQMPFLEYMHENIFMPLDMNATMGDWAERDIENRAAFYGVKNGKYKKAFKVNISNKWAGGGLLSRPIDLIKMANTLLNDQFLKPETKAKLFEPQPLDNGEMNRQNYAIGWRIDTTTKILEDKGIHIIHHGGSIMGANALLMLFPEYNLSIAMMMNRSGSSRELFSAVYEMAKVVIEQQEKTESLEKDEPQ